jgi:hypothetical protein
VAIFLILSQFILTIRVQVDVFSCNILDFFRREEKTVVCFTTYIHSVNMSSLLSIKVHNILMMEVLNGAQQILTITEWNLSLTFVITANTLPYISQHKLLLLLSNGTYKAEFEEKLRHLSAPNFDIRLICVCILWLLYNVKLKTCLLEISIKSVVDHFIG